MKEFKNIEKSGTKKVYSFKNDLKEKLLEVVRVTKVVQGGKRIRFRAVVTVGNKKGIVGIGVGRASDFGSAVNKAILNAKKNVYNVYFTKDFSIPSVSCEKYGAAKVILIPAKPGVGILAGGSPKAILEMSGITNVLCKQLGSTNILNNARATLNALIKLKKKSKVFDILKRKVSKKFLRILRSPRF